MEPKLCEAGCGRSFLRPKPITARAGQKTCKACGKMPNSQLQRQYKEQRIREIFARAGLFAG
jgi:hypothetical protein